MGFEKRVIHGLQAVAIMQLITVPIICTYLYFGGITPEESSVIWVLTSWLIFVFGFLAGGD